MKKRYLGLAVLAALAMGAEAQNKGVIKIASQSPLSGGQSKLGVAISNGIRLAIDDEGKLITSLGFKLEYAPFDDQAKAEQGVANANRMINDADILGMVGHLNSGVAIPSSEVYARVNLATVSPANTNPLVTDRKSTLAIMSRICGRDDVQGPAGADFVVDTLKAKKIYVINDKTAYGEGLAAAFAMRAKAKGATTTEIGVEATERDFATILNRAAAEKPDVVYYAGIYDQGGPLLKQMRARGLNQPFVGGDGLDGSDLQALAGAENMKNVFFTTTAVPLSSLPAAKGFAARYNKKFSVAAEGYAAYGYDAARVVIRAIAAAAKANKNAKPSRAAVAAEVRKVKFTGVTGPIAFNSRGDLPVAKYVIVQATPNYDDNKVSKIVTVAAPTPELK
ncbi:MAG: branched-chain amino acid ABC transporter substrate-binding protein [Deinococcales bacterium]